MNSLVGRSISSILSLLLYILFCVFFSYKNISFYCSFIWFYCLFYYIFNSFAIPCLHADVTKHFPILESIITQKKSLPFGSFCIKLINTFWKMSTPGCSFPILKACDTRRNSVKLNITQNKFTQL